MRKVNFIRDFGDLTSTGGWEFKKEYPSLLSNEDDPSEIWISEERLQIAVGSRKVASRVFVWMKYNKLDDSYDCSVGIVPDKSSLDDHAVAVLNRSSGKKFFKNPYLHLLLNMQYRAVFIYQKGVLEDLLEATRDAMFLSAEHIEDNILTYLDDTAPGSHKEDGATEYETGWSVLLRARAGSLG